MTNEVFLNGVNNELDKCFSLFKHKNETYASNTDPFNNFTQYAQLAKCSKEDALLHFMGKQVVSIYNKDTREDDASYDERLRDIINYCAILLVMRNEVKNNG